MLGQLVSLLGHPSDRNSIYVDIRGKDTCNSSVVYDVKSSKAAKSD